MRLLDRLDLSSQGGLVVRGYKMFNRSTRAIFAVILLGCASLLGADAFANRFDPTLDVALVAWGIGSFVGLAVILFAWNVATYRKK